MSENRVSASISEESRTAIKAAIQTIKENLPFLKDLTPEDRRTMLKLGDRSVAFVRGALGVATENPDFLPRSFDIDEMRKDVELYQDLNDISRPLTQLLELVEDTKMDVGSEAYSAALVVYRYAQNSPQGAGLDDVVDDLGRRFARRSRQAEAGESSEES